MTTYTNSFEGGTLGATITAGNSGGASGDAWSDIGGTTTSSSLTYVNDQVMHGALAAKIGSFTTDATRAMYWNVPAGTTWIASRFYFRVSALPSDYMVLWYLGGDSSRLYLFSDGSLRIDNLSAQAFRSAAGKIQAGVWYRVETVLGVGTSSTNGTIKLNVYVGDSLTPISGMTFSSSAQNTGTTALTTVQFGRPTTEGALPTWTTWIDSVAASPGATDFIGPYVAPSAPSNDGYVKVWNGTTWVARPLRVWDGAQWSIHPAKGWTGAAWKTARGSDAPVWSEDFASLDMASSTNPNGFWRANDTWQSVDAGYADFGAGGSTWDLNPNEVIGGAKRSPFTVANSILTITAQRTPTAWQSDIAAKNGGTAPPWCGGILISNTNNASGRFGYGYYEIKARIPVVAKGIFPALWLFAVNGLNAGKEKAEIDLMEVFGHATGRPWTTTVHEKKQDGTAATGATAAQVTVATTDTDTSGWHTYGLDWQSDHLRFYQDNTLIGELTGADATFFQGVTMSIRLNFAMDASWFAAADLSDVSTPNTLTMDVDYVRKWTTKP